MSGAIHDLGYKRYVGSRRAQSTRWRVIMRNQLTTAWKTWWRYKASLGGAIAATFAIGAVMLVLSDKSFPAVGVAGGMLASFKDGLLPLSTTWYCKFGFIVSLTVGAGTIASDAETGAFTFYFARSVAPRDYVLGKLAGLGLLNAAIMLVGPVLLAGLRLGMSHDRAELIANLGILPKALVVGMLGTVIYTAVPLGFSALLGRRRSAVGLWAGYYLIVGVLAGGLSLVVSPAIAAVDLPASLTTVSLHLFGTSLLDKHIEVPLAPALISIGAHVGLALTVLIVKVRSSHLAGIGGAS